MCHKLPTKTDGPALQLLMERLSV